MRVLILGANGQLGSDLVRLWRGPALDVIPATRAHADVTDATAVAELVARARPDAVVNTTAFHNLPLCEEDPDTAFRVNVTGGRNVALAAARAGALVVQVSTDYVFDGEKETPYLEEDCRRALNVYGAAKIATEDVVRQAHANALIVRLSGLYGLAGSAGKGGNFVETMLRMAREDRPIRVVSDQVTAPTNTAEVAEALLPLVVARATGIVHLAAAGATSWYDFARAIFALAGLEPDLAPVSSDEFGGPVQRPRYSVLGTTRASALPHWRVGLSRYIKERSTS